PPVIVHVPIAAEQPAGAPVHVAATVTDADSAVDRAVLYFRRAGDPGWLTVAMAANGDAYTADIPGFAVGAPGVQYYIEAVDASGNTAHSPVGAPQVAHLFPVADPRDEEPPVIVHTPIADQLMANAEVLVTAHITDNTRVRGVTLNFRRQGDGNWLSVPMPSIGDDYAARIPVFVVAPPGVDYYLEAVDVADNTATHPAGAPAMFHRFSVPGEPLDEAAPVIEHTPVDDGQDEGVAVTIEAFITDQSGVARAEVVFRRVGDHDWVTLGLVDQGDDFFAVDLPARLVAPPAMQYYLHAIDGGQGFDAFDPPGATEEVYRFTVIEADEDGPQIVLDAVPANVSAGTPLPVAAQVTDPSGVARVELRYFSEATGGWVAAEMAADEGDRFVAVIAGAFVVEPAVRLFVEAEDALGNVSTVPGAGSDDPIEVAVEAEREEDPPLIVHSPANSGEQGAPLPISAIITDASGVADAAVLFREAGTDDWIEAALHRDGDTDRFIGTIPAIATRGEAIEYYLTAADTLGNAAVDPGDAPDTYYSVILRATITPDEGLPEDMGPADEDMGPDEADGMMIEPDLGLPMQDGGVGGGGSDDGGSSGCACDAANGGSAPFAWFFVALLAVPVVRRRRRI
ncbi:MAG: hypothetical protein KC620_19060, partial [Myxococcales bacterium]|nr:hypothetical protein [Myxococcales bacterium]